MFATLSLRRRFAGSRPETRGQPRTLHDGVETSSAPRPTSSGIGWRAKLTPHPQWRTLVPVGLAGRSHSEKSDQTPVSWVDPEKIRPPPGDGGLSPGLN